MSTTSTNGQAQSGFGKLEQVAGDAIDSPDLAAKGDANQLQGKAKEMAGQAQQAFGQVASDAREAASKVGAQAKQAYGVASDKAQELKERVEPFVQEKPYMALLAAFGLGFVASRIIAPGGPKTIYVKPRD